MLTALVLACVPPAQLPRPPVALTADSDPGGARVASAHELSAALVANGNSTGLLLSTSDGRGLVWSPPLVVKDAAASDFVAGRTVAVDGTDALIAWSDDRYYQPALWPVVALNGFVRTYDHVTGALGPEFELDTGFPKQLTMVQGLGLATARVGGALHVHVALAIHVGSSHGSPTTDRVLLYTSLDAGQTFAAPLSVSVGLPTQVTDVAVEAVGSTVHVAWIDERDTTPQLHYRRSSDAGASLDFASEQQLTSGTHKFGFAMDAQGPVVGFAFTDYIPDFTYRNLQALVSLDAGTTFGPVQSPPFINPVGDIPDNPVIEVAPSRASVLLAWDMLDGGARKVHASRSSDGGTTWSAPTPLSQGPGRYPSLAVSEPGRSRIVAAWQDFGIPRASVSLDEGLTWQAPVQLTASSMYPFAVPNLAWNERYQNLIVGWADPNSPSTAWIGGFRPQTLTPLGFSAGSTQVSMQCSAFDDGNSVAFVLGSLAPGSLALPFGDGREFGLAPDSLFVSTLGSALHGALAAPLDASGSGTTPILGGLALPAGLSLHLAALSVNLGTFVFGDISDVVHVQL